MEVVAEHLSPTEQEILLEYLVGKIETSPSGPRAQRKKWQAKLAQLRASGEAAAKMRALLQEVLDCVRT